ncbi:peptidylprolyl isomerase [Patescibacteria group bacterium]|nr:peptidylprolyl isomerase [Patescibacteria group bacterium]
MGYNIVFGKVVKGMSVVKEINGTSVNKSVYHKPLYNIKFPRPYDEF